jgi:sugar phosphate isomerase/epimerase
MEEILTLTKSRGMDAIEIRGVGGVLDNAAIEDFAEENATKTKRMLEEYSIRPLVLGTSCSFHTEEKYEKAMLEGHEAIRIAARMGFPYIRVFGNNVLPEDREGSIARVIRGIDTLCHYGATLGVTVLLEVHGDFNREETLAPVLSALSGVKNFGVIWDIAHSHTHYGNNFARFYDFIRPYIKHVHIKDSTPSENGARKLCLPGNGDIPIKDIIRKMEADGYCGCYSLEWERHWHPELLPIEDALDSFLKIASEI